MMPKLFGVGESIKKFRGIVSYAVTNYANILISVPGERGQRLI